MPINKTEKILCPCGTYNLRRKAIKETRKLHKVLESPEGSWEISAAMGWVVKEGGSQKVTLQPNLKGMRKQAY